MFCKHEWELLKETLTESKATRLDKTLNQFEIQIRRTPFLDSMLEQKLIQYFTCKKCGELKRFVEEI